MPDYEPLPGYTDLCEAFRSANNSRDCTWNIITTVWEARGMQTLFGSKGVNNLIVKVEHCNIEDSSKVFEQEINAIVNRVYTREYVGQPTEFFLSTVRIACYNKNILGLSEFIGEVSLGVLDIFMSDGHMIPMQWFPLVNPSADLPVEPLGFIKLNCIINTLGERGAVQFRPPDDLADWELKRDPPQILQIPRLNLRKVAPRQYNIKISLYQGFDLGINRFTADPKFRVISCCGIVESDAVPNTLKPSWNTLLQVPWYEPAFQDLIICEVHDAGIGGGKLAHLVLSWRQISTTPPSILKTPRWIDMYEREEKALQNWAMGAKTLYADGPKNKMVEWATKAWPFRGYEAPMVYGGRVLLSVEVEQRSERKEPSPANIALKPKDCELWKDPMQKCFFRFQMHYACSLPAGSAQVEFSIGRRSVRTAPKSANETKRVEFYQAVELECDFPFDDIRDNPNGRGKLSEGQGVWDPEFFVDNLPDCIVRVYRTDPGLDNLSVMPTLIGFWRGPVKAMLAGKGDPFADWRAQVFVGRDRDDNGTGGRHDGVESIMLAPGEELPRDSKTAPWGREGNDDSIRILNPYRGFQLQRLERDGTCGGDADAFPGFVAFSAKLWLPDRARCANMPPKGPPILSCWREWNARPFPSPFHEYLQWYAGFNVRAHVYQARLLPARNGTGVANAQVRLAYGHYPPDKSHVAELTNNPTWDKTLCLTDLEVMLLPKQTEKDSRADDYLCDAEDLGEVEDNLAMLRMSPRVELSVWETGPAGDMLLGRRYFNPEEILTRKTNPEWVALYRGDPNVESGELLCSLQFIHTDERILKAPLEALRPDKSQVTKADPCNKAPVRPLAMLDSKIQIQILGLRDLQPPKAMGLYPSMYQPMVLVACDDPKTATNTKPCGRPTPSNATYMECVEIDILLPEDKLFAPYLEFYIYDNLLGLPMAIGEKSLIAYGMMPMSDFYLDDSTAEESLEAPADEDEEAAKKRLEKLRRKEFLALTKTLVQEGHLETKMRKVLERFYDKKDEAVKKAFEQYRTAPEPQKFVERVLDYFGAGNGPQIGSVTQGFSKLSEAAKTATTVASTTARRMSDAGTAVAKGAAKAAAKGASTKALTAPASGGGAATAAAVAAAAAAPAAGAGGDVDKADRPGDDAGQAGEPGPSAGGGGGGGGAAAAAEDEGGAVDNLDADKPAHEDDVLPDRQDEVDTPDGKISAEWMLLRDHANYPMPLEEEPTFWGPLLDPTFDELELFRGPINNVKQKSSERVGILKMMVKLYQKEALSEEALNAGMEPKYLDMEMFKKGMRVEYEMPDIYENFPKGDVEIRVYLLKAFQITPRTQDEINTHESIVRMTLGTDVWEWQHHYDPVKALNPQFYRCAKMKATLPGASMLKISVCDLAKLKLPFGVAIDTVPEEVGHTVVDLEDRWFCEEWREETIFKPREIRDLYNDAKPGITVGKIQIFIDAVSVVEAQDFPIKDVNVSGRQMPLEMRMIIWNLKEVSPKEGYTSNVRVSAELIGWGSRLKETDTDMGVKQSRNAMFNYRLKFKGIKYPSPDPTFPAKDFLMRITVWSDDFFGLLPPKAIAQGILPLGEMFRECFQRNLGKPSPDDMEVVNMRGMDAGTDADEDGTKYPFRWFRLCHPGGPACRNNKDFKKPGYDFTRNCQCQIQLTVQAMPRAKAKALPASLGFKSGPAKIRDPNRPPQPANPLFAPDQCAAYIVYTCKECCLRCAPCCICLCCILLVVVFIVGYFYLQNILALPAL